MLKTQNLLLSFILFIALSISCNNSKKNSKEAIVAAVGDNVISVKDFLINYESGLPHLKNGANPKEKYLTYMINELLLAQAGYELGLDRTDRIKKMEEQIRRELLVETVFDAKVKKNIVLSEQEIREAVQESRISWKMQFWSAPDLHSAREMRRQMVKIGFDKALINALEKNREINMHPKDFQTGYVSWLDLDEEVLNKIENLQINEISEPIFMKDRYFLVRITDIRRKALTEYDYQNEYEKYRQILFYKKLKQQASAYIKKVMEPQNVTTKRQPLEELCRLISSFFEQDSIQNITEYIKGQNKAAFLNTKLVYFGAKAWTVEQTLQKINFASIKRQRFKNKLPLTKIVSLEIALAVRNETLVAIAENEGLDKNPEVLRQLQRWKQKWVYREMRKTMGKNIRLKKKDLRTYFQTHLATFRAMEDNPRFEDFEKRVQRVAYRDSLRKLMLKKVTELRRIYPVKINYDVLDTLQTVPFTGNSGMSLQIFKRSSQRLAAPIVDGIWVIK